MKIKIVNSINLEKDLIDLFLKLTHDVEILDPEKNKIKARRVLGCFAATKLPFIAIYNDEMVPIKGFYSEVNQVNFKELSNYFNSLNKVE